MSSNPSKLDYELAVVRDLLVAAELDGQFRIVDQPGRPEQDPDVLIEDGATRSQVGIEVTQVLTSTDGRDAFLEWHLAEGVRAICVEILGPRGDLDAELVAGRRPTDIATIDRWCRAFRAWLSSRVDSILASPTRSDTSGFPPRPWGNQHEPPRLRIARRYGPSQDVEALLAEERALDEADWLRVSSIHAPVAGPEGWNLCSVPGADHLADRHQHDIADLVVERVRTKIAKAAGYQFSGPLWLTLLNAVREQPGGIRERVAALHGIERFERVFLLSVPRGIADAARPAARATQLWP